MKHDAIIFDLDGTLVDTISLYERAFLEVLRRRGAEVTTELFRKWYMGGIHLREIASLLHFPEEDIPQVRLERDELYEQLLRTEIQWMPGATLALAAANAHGTVGIVTGSWLSYLKAMRPRIDIFPFAKSIVTADDIHMFMKPHPHGLLLCADRMGVEPKHCMYIGDQKFDVDAANAAGMTSCLVPSAYTPANAGEDAALVVERLEEVPQHF